MTKVVFPNGVENLLNDAMADRMVKKNQCRIVEEGLDPAPHKKAKYFAPGEDEMKEQERKLHEQSMPSSGEGLRLLIKKP